MRKVVLIAIGSIRILLRRRQRLKLSTTNLLTLQVFVLPRMPGGRR
jgi:hypothetical protein